MLFPIYRPDQLAKLSRRCLRSGETKANEVTNRGCRCLNGAENGVYQPCARVLCAFCPSASRGVDDKEGWMLCLTGSSPGRVALSYLGDTQRVRLSGRELCVLRARLSAAARNEH